MVTDISASIDVCAAHYGKDAEAMRAYLVAGQERALALLNRGPIRFDDEGVLAADIRAAYSAYGFYVFKGAVSAEELADLEAGIDDLRSRFPLQPGGETDAQGNPAVGAGNRAPTLQWVRPLSDPLGGTELWNGRHQVKLFEPQAAQDAPEFAPFVLMGHVQFSDECLRAYAHPQLLRVAAAINGEDFAPFHDVIFFKDPGLGAAVSWHQDGDTHWDHPAFDEDIHGFNFMLQLYGSTAVNGVWVVPGTHKLGKMDIKAMIAEAGSERLPDAVPLVCEAGDVVICNRQLVHGSFANTGFEPRLTINYGFHRRASVLNIKGAGMHSEAAVYDDAHIRERSRALGLAIAARRARFPEEAAFEYKPLAGETFVYDAAARASLHDYNLRDLSI
ncbi:phytanoyl-CoA dioxygenase family protein [Qipengyuania qiaonensis]|uniref:Phytanoyl-CoA dioxygenase family protein n=1 Tax=Qipengyuania qiaonensis TaxID=2867240 RepID=A0ABS7J5V5_9SPHN|nr:phytanoyl-CoA dioxygenase family protein [Qipengyuania qiaonensis]MBX7482722.1 phytanoyl-CoA dioxygenase family protein [Qipengyuania qiaonensis]